MVSPHPLPYCDLLKSRSDIDHHDCVGKSQVEYVAPSKTTFFGHLISIVEFIDYDDTTMAVMSVNRRLFSCHE